MASDSPNMLSSELPPPLGDLFFLPVVLRKAPYQKIKKRALPRPTDLMMMMMMTQVLTTSNNLPWDSDVAVVQPRQGNVGLVQNVLELGRGTPSQCHQEEEDGQGHG